MNATSHIRKSPKTVLIPLAMSDGRLMSIAQATEDKEYLCRECKKLLVPKNKKKVDRKRRPHFAHKADEGNCGGGMGELHKLAREWVKQCIEDFLCHRSASPTFTAKCPKCSGEWISVILEGPFSVDCEVQYARFQLDVAVLSEDGRPLFGIEIFDKSAVPEDKEQKLNKLRLPWVELDAEHVVWSDEPRWNARRFSPSLIGCKWHMWKDIQEGIENAANEASLDALITNGPRLVSLISRSLKKQRKKK